MEFSQLDYLEAYPTKRTIRRQSTMDQRRRNSQKHLFRIRENLTEHKGEIIDSYTTDENAATLLSHFL